MFRKMFCSFFNFLTVIFLAIVHHCSILTRAQVQNASEKTEIDMQEVYFNSSYLSDFQSGQIPDFESIITNKSKRASIQAAADCFQVQPELINGYYHSFILPDRALNDIFSAGYAYLLVIKYKVLEKNPRYFDIIEFHTAPNILFPPTLSVVCYDTAYNMHHETPLFDFDYGRGHIFRILKTRKPTNLQSTSGYMIQRQKMYGELGALVEQMQAAQKETLITKCQETTYTKITDLISELLRSDPIQAMSPNYSLEQFNEIAQMFIGDIVAYEMIRQACRAMGSARIPKVTSDDWAPIAVKLQEALPAIRNNWHATQLNKDILSRPIDQSRWSIFSPNIENSFIEALTQKYYEHGFRVSVHKGWTAQKASIICTDDSKIKCIDIGWAMVLVRWKSLKPSALAVPYQAPQKYIEFLKVTPPASSYRFTALYAKVHAALSKLQNAVNYFRVNEREKQHYKKVRNLFNAFNDAGYAILSKTAEDFAKTLDVLSVFRKEYLPLVDTLSEIAMHVTEADIEKVWRLIERSFHEMNFYMADIEDHIMMIHMEIITESRYIQVHEAVMDFFVAYYVTIRSIRNAFNEYRLEAGFYAQAGNRLGATKVLKEFIDKCGPVNRGIQVIGNGLLSAPVKEATYQLGKLAPFYLQTFYLLTSYDTAYLSLFSIFCACQKYRWLAEGNLAEGHGMNISDTQKFVNDTMKEVMDISEVINKAVEITTVDAYKSQFYWIDRLSSHISTERNAAVSHPETKRIADKLKDTFPWNNFSVLLIKHDRSGRLMNRDWRTLELSMREEIFYCMFFANPDYSLVREDVNDQWIIVVNWANDKRDPAVQKRNVATFGFRAGSSELCDMSISQWISNFKNPENVKSFFVWRSYEGHAWHNTKHRDNSGRTGRWDFVDELCCSMSGEFLGISFNERYCWYEDPPKHPRAPVPLRPRHRDAHVGITAIGNYGENFIHDSEG